MTYLKRSLLMLVTALGMFGMVACDDYDTETFNYVDKTTVSLNESTLHTLSFKWTEVDDVTNYKYVLVQGNVETSKDNPVASGTTTNTAIAFENLTPGVNYTLWVTPVSDKGLVSRSFYGTFSTVAITPLDTPTVKCNLDESTHIVSVSWTAVDYATDYTWYYTVGDETFTETTTELEASFSAKGFSTGVYSVYVVANSGVEEHTNSLAGSAVFSVGEVPIAQMFEGKYDVYNEGYTCYNLSAWAEFTEEHTTTVTALTSNTIKITNVYRSIGLEGTIDEGTGYIYFNPNKSSKYEWYLIGYDGSGDYQQSTNVVVGYYDEDYSIYLWDDDGYAWTYSYYYSGSGYYPYWIGNTAMYRAE